MRFAGIWQCKHEKEGRQEGIIFINAAQTSGKERGRGDKYNEFNLTNIIYNFSLAIIEDDLTSDDKGRQVGGKWHLLSHPPSALGIS